MKTRQLHIADRFSCVCVYELTLDIITQHNKRTIMHAHMEARGDANTHKCSQSDTGLGVSTKRKQYCVYHRLAQASL